eukprot:scaffold13347_cov132-Isochrysis_galbana.AAC.1
MSPESHAHGTGTRDTGQHGRLNTCTCTMCAPKKSRCSSLPVPGILDSRCIGGGLAAPGGARCPPHGDARLTSKSQPTVNTSHI